MYEMKERCIKTANKKFCIRARIEIGLATTYVLQCVNICGVMIVYKPTDHLTPVYLLCTYAPV